MKWNVINHTVKDDSLDVTGRNHSHAVVALKWADKRQVSMLSTAHDDDKNTTCVW